jgi:hypothetical protein
LSELCLLPGIVVRCILVRSVQFWLKQPGIDQSRSIVQYGRILLQHTDVQERTRKDKEKEIRVHVL